MFAINFARCRTSPLHCRCPSHILIVESLQQLSVGALAAAATLLLTHEPPTTHACSRSLVSCSMDDSVQLHELTPDALGCMPHSSAHLGERPAAGRSQRAIHVQPRTTRYLCHSNRVKVCCVQLSRRPSVPLQLDEGALYTGF
jgi:hypothetical protein